MKLSATSLILIAFIIGVFTLINTESAAAQHSVQWINLTEAQKRSMDDQKPVFIFVEAEWCGFCKKMKRDVFPENEISDLMNREYYGVLIDLESKKEIIYNGKTMTEREFARSMEVMQTPTMIFLNNAGEEMGRQPGYLDGDDFYKLLRYVISDDFGTVSFNDFSAGK